MNFRTLLSPKFTSCIVTLIVGCSIAEFSSAANPLPTLPSIKTLQMAQASGLTGSWWLANMTAADLPTPMLPAGDTALTAEFEGDRISGSSGCNRFMGGYETEAGKLTIGPLAGTFKACEQLIMTQETQYLAALQGAQRYEVNQDGLQIFYQTAEGSGVLRFTSQNVRGLW